MRRLIVRCCVPHVPAEDHRGERQDVEVIIFEWGVFAIAQADENQLGHLD
jgi:hypothetical protein